MWTRRLFTQALAGAFSWLVTGKLTKAEAPAPIVPLLPDGFVAAPDWCPKGWLPVMGQTISAEQYPDLFRPNTEFRRALIKWLYDRAPVRVGRVAGLAGKKWVPLFSGKDSATLETFTPIERSLLSQSGWQDQLTHVVRAPDNKVIVQVMAVEHQRHANGRPYPAGFQSTIIVDKDDFERAYGSVLPHQGGSDGMYYSGYEFPGGLVSDKLRADVLAESERRYAQGA